MNLCFFLQFVLEIFFKIYFLFEQGDGGVGGGGGGLSNITPPPGVISVFRLSSYRLQMFNFT